MVRAELEPTTSGFLFLLTEDRKCTKHGWSVSCWYRDACNEGSVVLLNVDGNLVPRASFPLTSGRKTNEQPFHRACAIDADWNCAVNRITEFWPVIRFTAQSQSASIAHAWNGCFQSSCFPTAGQGERSSGNEIVLMVVWSLLKLRFWS